MSEFCCLEPKNYIAKARSKIKTTAGYKRLERLSKHMSRAIEVDLFKGLKTFKKKVSTEDVLRAWKTGSYGQITHTIPWNDLPAELQGYQDHMDSTYADSAAFTIKSLPKPTQRNLRFDLNNPRLRKYIHAHTGELVIGIHKDTQAIIQQSIKRSFSKAWTPNKVARHIKDSIGLDPRREQALANYRDMLEDKGEFTEARVDKLVDGYSERLLKQRCMTIARTETRFATNQGQLSVWREAANQDLLDRATTRKVWIVDGNPCDICEPMDGIAVPLDGMWILNNGDSVEIPTDSHPNCMCGMELDFGETEIEED